MSVFNGPITAGVLGTVDKKNLSASYFAPANGGGGGSGGPILVCSTIYTNGNPDGSLTNGADIVPGSSFFVSSAALTSFIVGDSQDCNLKLVYFYGDFGGDEFGPAFTVDSGQGGLTLNISSSQQVISTMLPGPQASLQLQGDTQGFVPTQYGGDLEMGTLVDGRSYIAACLQDQSNPQISTLMLIGDGVNVSSFNVSSINGAAYPPPAALPEDAGFNNLECSTIGVGNANGLSIAGFPQPLITYGATTLNGSGTATVGLDHTYTNPYYPFVTYRGTLGATTSTLSVSTLAGDQFAIYGEANASVQYMVCGN